MVYRPLAELQHEIQQNLDVIHSIDTEIQQKKDGYKEPHSKISRLRQMISDGEYLEAQDNKLF